MSESPSTTATENMEVIAEQWQTGSQSMRELQLVVALQEWVYSLPLVGTLQGGFTHAEIEVTSTGYRLTFSSGTKPTAGPGLSKLEQ